MEVNNIKPNSSLMHFQFVPFLIASMDHKITWLVTRYHNLMMMVKLKKKMEEEEDENVECG